MYNSGINKGRLLVDVRISQRQQPSSGFRKHSARETSDPEYLYYIYVVPR